VKQEAEKYPNASIVWAQEEPKNMGAWTYVHPRIITALGEKNFRSIRYAGRRPSAATATGNKRIHLKEQKDLLDLALSS
jgi:2-oxoglutarate dehydrogenase E1 component